MQKPDVFDPTKKYVFTNWSDEEFRCRYANPEFAFSANPRYSQERNNELYEEAYRKEGIKEAIVPAGKFIEVPEWLAFHLCKHFLDREIMKGIKKDFGSISQKDNDGKANAGAEGEILSMHSPSSREVLEQKTIKLIGEGEESPLVLAIRAEERAKIEQEFASLKQEEKATPADNLAKARAAKALKAEATKGEFAELTGANVGAELGASA
jgi:hypothetical protein